VQYGETLIPRVRELIARHEASRAAAEASGERQRQILVGRRVGETGDQSKP
jgi:hypothetical protein